MKISLLSVLLVISCRCFAQLPSYVPANGIVGYWPFNNNANDLSSNLNHGSVHGATPTADRFNVTNHAYAFNGSSDYISVLNNASLSGFSGLSLASWIKSNTITGDNAIIAKWYQSLNCGSQSDTYISHLQNGYLQFVADFNNTVGLPARPAMDSTYLNTWKHLVFVFRSSTSLEVYVDGNMIYTTATSGTGICSSTNDLIFGANESSGSLIRFFDGALDDIGVWSRGLSDCEIKKLYLGSSLTASSSNTLVCPGGSATITLNGAVSYSLNGSPIGTNAIVSPSVSTTYTIIGNYGLAGCQDDRRPFRENTS
jgi:hypothetical protein